MEFCAIHGTDPGNAMSIPRGTHEFLLLTPVIMIISMRSCLPGRWQRQLPALHYQDFHYQQRCANSLFGGGEGEGGRGKGEGGGGFTCRATSHLARSEAGRNSMKRASDTGTPPKPTPTKNLAAISSCNMTSGHAVSTIYTSCP